MNVEATADVETKPSLLAQAQASLEKNKPAMLGVAKEVGVVAVGVVVGEALYHVLSTLR